MGASDSHLIPNGSPTKWLMLTLTFLEPDEQRNVISTNRRYSSFQHSDMFHRALCICLKNYGVYVPQALPASERNWKQFYQELLPLRKMWLQSTAEELTKEQQEEALLERKAHTSQKDNSARFRVKVYARFRPIDEARKLEAAEGNPIGDISSASDNSKDFVLPLHQRLNMIRMSGGAKTRREALRVLASEGDWFGAKWAGVQQQQQERAAASKQEKDTEHPTNDGQNDENENNKNLLAACEAENEMRSPLKFTRRQERTPMVSKVQSVDTALNRVTMLLPDVGLREFAFDGVVEGKGDSRQQERCYSLMCKRLVCDFLNGYNSTCVAYGQTASGKTYTMIGPDGVNTTGPGSAAMGVIPRACMEVLGSLNDSRRASLGLESSLSISYIEIYGDFVCDLLKGGERVGHSKVAAQRFVLSGTVEMPVATLDDIYHALRLGDDTRRRAATAMNDRSSRAHALVILTLNTVNTRTGINKQSRLFLADLGGSERVEKSKIDGGASRVNKEASEFSAGFHQGDRMREAVYINLGLLALKRCIEALNESSVYVPFQDSKLTMLLSTGLGGDSKTSIIITNSLDPAHAAETGASLRFGERCALVENEARNEVSILASVLAKLDENIASLEKVIVEKEVWEEKCVTRKDMNAEEGTFESSGMGGVETQKVTYLTGAEDERKELSALLARRRSFVGDTSTEDQVETTVMGFGKDVAKLYGLGLGFDEKSDAKANNERFHEEISAEQLSKVVQKKGAKGWTKADDLEKDPKKLEQLAKKAKRSKLVYSGISA